MTRRIPGSMVLVCALSAALYAQTDSFLCQSAMRSFIVHAPQGISNPPLVICMHGLGSNATQQRMLSGFNGIADRQKFVVVYPNGIDNQWDITGNRDVTFISALIDTMKSRHSIDLSRVYATGMSMGGYMSHRLACALTSRIAAIASVAGLNASSYSCSPSRAIPVMQIHGTADSTVKYSGVAAMISGWVTRNGCPATAVTIDPYPASNATSVVKKDTYGPCRENSEVVLLTVKGDGHTWPGANWGGATMDISASEEIWTFFSRFTLSGLAVASKRPHNRLPAANCQFIDDRTALFDMHGARITSVKGYSGIYVRIDRGNGRLALPGARIVSERANVRESRFE